MKRAVILMLVACALVAASVSQTAFAATSPRPVVDKRTKLDSRLSQVVRGHEAGNGAAVARSVGLEVRSGRVQVVLEPAGGVAATETAVAAAGGVVEARHENLVQALVPFAAVETLGRASTTARIRAPHIPVEQAVTGEEIARSSADVFQHASWTGAGVKVAIIDAGFSGLATRQADGDIPAGVVTQDMCGGGFSTASVHGAGVAEILHEVAPQAQLHLICIDSDVTLGQAKEYVKANNIPIVNMSLAFLNAGRGDGSGGPATVDGIVADARANGVLWVNSAGNYQQRHWSGTFNGPLTQGALHTFAEGDQRNTIALSVGQQTCVYLKWDDWPGSAQDYDLYLVRESDGATVASSGGGQTGAQSPSEALCYTAPSTGNYGVEIEVWEATATPRFDMIATAGSLEHRVTSGSVTEPASSPNAMAVGALCWSDFSLRTYSSFGPTIDGRIKPDISGLDGVSGGTYGTPSGCVGGFTGTSASSPHVAGLAALAKHQNPSLTPAQLQRWLEARAQDIGLPGKDINTGWGRAFVHTFTDSPPATPLQSYIERLFTQGVTTGCTPLDPASGVRLYCPNQQVTRRDMAVFIVRANGLTELLSPTPTFADVPSSMFGYGHVERFYEQGITTGCATSPLRFCPLDSITRRDMAVFIVRAKGLTELLSPTPTFADVPSSMFGYGHVERFYQQGITTGCAVSPLGYCPLDFVDRKAMAAFLMRAFFGVP